MMNPVKKYKIGCSINQIFLIVVFMAIFILQIHADEACRAIKRCDICIQKKECNFCGSADFSGPRCDTEENLTKNKCQDFQKPSFSADITETTKDFKTISIESTKLKLPLDIEYKLDFDVTHKSNSPLDLYFLFDFSTEMNDDINLVRSFANEVVEKLNEISNNLRIGFGGFIDKTINPFMDVVEMKKQNNEDIYLFRQYLSLKDDPTTFSEKISSVSIYKYLDKPEAVFDAILQVLVCKDRIGWREDSKKILMILTASVPHAAGIETISHIFKPATLECYVREKFFNKDYVEWTGLDIGYPSIGMVKKAFQESGVTPIFGYSEKIESTYKKIINFLEEVGAAGGTYKKNKDGFLNFILEEYKKTTENIKVVHEEKDAYDITVEPTCPGNSKTDKNGCLGVEIDKVVQFRVGVTLKTCLEEDLETELTIPSYGKINLMLSSHCTCPCSNEKVVSSPECSNAGSLQCFECDCDEKRYGTKCECTGDQNEDLKKCQSSKTHSICSSHGKCQCGKCVCEANYYGEHCGCNDKICPILDGKICAGNGTCKCGACVCNDGYTGLNCADIDCEFHKSKCMTDDQKICNSAGKCDCGVCRCDAGYDGSKCENCWFCSLQCATYKKIAFNKIFPDKNYEKPTFRQVDNPMQDSEPDEINPNQDPGPVDIELDENIQVLDSCDKCSFEKKQTETDLSGTTCSFSFGKCYYFYSYSIAENSDIKIEYLEHDEENHCTRELNVYMVVGTSLGIVILIGLSVMVAWKIIIYTIDKKEFSGFMEEQRQINFGTSENPLYENTNTNVS